MLYLFVITQLRTQNRCALLLELLQITTLNGIVTKLNGAWQYGQCVQRRLITRQSTIAARWRPAPVTTKPCHSALWKRSPFQAKKMTPQE